MTHGGPETSVQSETTLVAPSLRIQVFGRTDSRATQRCLRFFRERRIDVSFVDLARKPLAPAELGRFRQRFGAQALIDPESRAYRTAGLGYMRMDDDEMTERLMADPGLLRLPLTRNGTQLAVGADEATWRSWLR